MEVEWMDAIAIHLGRIADAHDRVAGALERIAKSAEVASVDKLLDAYGQQRESLRSRGVLDSLRDKFNQLAHEYAERKADVTKDPK
jgi:hypothetical protein